MVTELQTIEATMRDMVNGCTKPYDAGLLIWQSAMRGIGGDSETMHPFWLIWGALTDWFELHPAEESEAEDAMLRASREWLNLNSSDEANRTAYFDRWIYDELGYEK